MSFYAAVWPMGTGTTASFGFQARQMPASAYGGWIQDVLEVDHINDSHEHWNAYPHIGTGFKLFGREARAYGRDVFRIAAGDWNISSEDSEVLLNIQILKSFGIDFVTLGNHDQDGGVASLSKALQQANFFTLASNLKVPPRSALYQRLLDRKLIREPVVLKTPRGSTYGVLGLTVPKVTQYLGPEVPMQGVDSLSFKESAKVLEEQIRYLKRIGVNRIILASHCGYDNDYALATNRISGVDVDGVDLIVGGHSHTELDGIMPGVNYVRNNYGRPVLILQTGKDGRAMGRSILGWTAQGDVVPLFNKLYNPRDFQKDPQINQLLDNGLGKSWVIGQMAMDVSTDDATCEGENGVANRIADVLRLFTKADVAFLRGVELRSEIFKGAFTQRDLQTLLPFNDHIATFRMTGAQIQNALDESARGIKRHNAHPGTMHPSGLRYTVDFREGRAKDVRLLNPQTGQYDTPLVMGKTYTVAASDFLGKRRASTQAVKADDLLEYPVFQSAPMLRRYPAFLRDAVGYYIQSQRGKPLSFQKEGRIQLVNQPGSSSSQGGPGRAQVNVSWINPASPITFAPRLPTQSKHVLPGIHPSMLTMYA